MYLFARLFRPGKRLIQRRCLQQMNKSREMGGLIGPVSYRGETPPHGAMWWRVSELITAVMFSWMGIMSYMHSGHIIGGDFPDINPEEWTDEELGIPADEEDVYPLGYIPLKDR
ncbi:uncharacterized protein LOC128237235 [Mya arenaria]|uniref:uncharacterized protein LOC128237235 n=1 Tax=Mya arenaria TaxID=6604 RepID=UPI0022E29748|nr:uncharacterized protein LOC128237235 [Mya arenaria]